MQALRSTLTLAVKGMRSLATYSYLSHTIFRLLRDSLNEEDSHLLKGVPTLGEEGEEEGDDSFDRTACSVAISNQRC